MKFLNLVLILISIQLVIEGSAVAQIHTKYLDAKEPRRLALVIANSSYSELGNVISAPADAKLMSDALVQMRFDVSHHVGFIDGEDLENKIIEPFMSKVRKDDNVVIYYSGHGFGIGGFNYLASEISRKNYTATEAASENIAVETIIASLLHKKPGHVLFIYDACRDVPKFKIKYHSSDGKKRTERPKGPVEPKRFREPQQNFQIHFASDWGESAAEDGDADTPSQFTGMLLKHIGLKDAPYVEISNLVYGDMEDTYGRRPELYRNTRLSVYVNTTPEFTKKQREMWLAILDRADSETIERFVSYNRLSPFIKAARLWLREYRRKGRIDRISISRYSPEAVERVWETGIGKSALYGVAAPVISLAFARTVESSEFLDSTSAEALGIREISGASDLTNRINSEGVARLYAAHRRAFLDTSVTAYGGPNLSSIKIDKLPANSQVKIEGYLRNDYGAWLQMAPVIQNSQEIRPATYIKLPNNMNSEPVFLGRPIDEITVSHDLQFPFLVDSASIENEIAEIRARGSAITWISIASPAIPNLNVESEEYQYEKYIHSVRLQHARRILKGLDVDPLQISYKTGDNKVEDGAIRLRVFGYTRQ